MAGPLREGSLEWQIAQGFSFSNTRYAILASTTIIIAEYFHLLELESTLIWPAKWKLSKLLFVVNRYLPFVVIAQFLFYNSAPSSTSSQACHGLLGGQVVGTLLACLFADAVLYLRLYAISKQDKIVRVILIINYTLVTLIGAVSTGLFIGLETFLVFPKVLPGTSPCIHVATKTSILALTMCYAILLYDSLFTTALLLWYGIKLYRAMYPMPPSALIKIFHRDGAVYFVVIAAVSIANAVNALIAPLQYRHLLANVQAIVHSVLATRMVLHLREVAQETVISESGESAGDQAIALRVKPSGSTYHVSDFQAATGTTTLS